jgi:hypothetical protein
MKLWGDDGRGLRIRIRTDSIKARK